MSGTAELKIDFRPELLQAALTARPDITAEGCHKVALEAARGFEADGMSPEDARWQGKELVEATLREIVAAEKPWNHDPVLRERLEEAGCRYANLIGVTDPDDGEMLTFRAQDRERHPGMMKSLSNDENGCPLPLYVDADAITLMIEVTGQPEQICRDWIEYEWSA